jgi:hypothetical protein
LNASIFGLPRYVRSSSTLSVLSPITITAHRAEQISTTFAKHASEVRPGFSVTPSTSPFSISAVFHPSPRFGIAWDGLQISTRPC